MSECQSGSSDTYLNYACYKRLKPKFKESIPGETGSGYLAEAKKKINIKHKNYPNEYEDFFTKIAGYIQQDGIFMSADRTIACRYINYLLNKKSRDIGMHLSNPDYTILKDFVKEFHVIKSSLTDGLKCSSEIEFLKYELYQKMALLYDLYDKYITLVEYPKPIKYYPCDILSNIISVYNSSIKDHQTTDDNLIKKLIELKKLIDKDVLPNTFNLDCRKKITDFSLSEKEKEEERQRLAKEQQRLAEEQQRLAKEQQRLAEEQQEQEKQQLKQEQLDSEEQQRHLRTALLQPKSYEQELEQGRLGQVPEQQVTYEHGQKYQVPYFQATLLPDIEKSELEGSYKVSQSFGESENSGIKKEQLQDQGVLGQMQNAFSTIVQNVDPAPVLGVSGGMGVLFILFKYTPFGSFFGGRRRRIHQIPRSFGGFPPDFANFQEYDGGSIGYSPMGISPFAE